MSGSNAYSTARDITHKRVHPGVGLPITLAFMCGHKGLRGGAEMRGRIPWRCAGCVGKGKA